MVSLSQCLNRNNFIRKCYGNRSRGSPNHSPTPPERRLYATMLELRTYQYVALKLLAPLVPGTTRTVGENSIFVDRDTNTRCHTKYTNLTTADTRSVLLPLPTCNASYTNPMSTARRHGLCTYFFHAHQRHLSNFGREKQTQKERPSPVVRRWGLRFQQPSFL